MKQKPALQKIGLILAALLILAGILAGCKAASPREAVKSAATATALNFSEAGSQFGFDKIRAMETAGSCHEEMTFYLKEAAVGTDLSGFYGSGFRMDADYSLADRKLTASTGVRVADYDALNMHVVLDDSNLYFSCPELFGNYLLGFNTETLAQDYPDAGLGEDFSFNIFDLIDEQLSETGKYGLSADTVKAVKDAYNTMADASTWAAGKKAELTIGGVSGKCKTYTLTIPAAQARTFLLNALTALLRDEFIELNAQSVFAEDVSYSGSYEQYITEALSEVEEGLQETLTQDVSVVFYVKGKYLRGADFVFENEGVPVKTELRFGLDKHPADHIELTLSEDDAVALSFSSSGSHILDAGKFTDQSTLRFDTVDEIVSLSFAAEYDTKSGAYDLSTELDYEAGADPITLSAAGTLTMDKDSMNATFDRIQMRLLGAEIVFSGSCSVSKSEGVSIDTANAQMLSDMTEEELDALDAELLTNLFSLIENLTQEVPALSALLYGASSLEG